MIALNLYFYILELQRKLKNLFLLTKSLFKKNKNVFPCLHFKMADSKMKVTFVFIFCMQTKGASTMKVAVLSKNASM